MSDIHNHYLKLFAQRCGITDVNFDADGIAEFVLEGERGPLLLAFSYSVNRVEVADSDHLFIKANLLDLDAGGADLHLSLLSYNGARAPERPFFFGVDMVTHQVQLIAELDVMNTSDDRFMTNLEKFVATALQWTTILGNQTKEYA